MAQKITKNVVGIHEETREPRWFRPGDKVPAAYRKSISNPAAYEGDEEELEEPEEELEDEGEGGDEEDLIGEDELADNYESPEVTNDDLRAELARRDLPVHGNKSELVERLREDDAETA